jgi:hypothetical protein
MSSELTNQTPDSTPSIEQMKKMMMVAQMRASADRNQMGFIGGYMDEKTGEVFMQTNMDQELADFMLPELVPEIKKLKNDEAAS